MGPKKKSSSKKKNGKKSAINRAEPGTRKEKPDEVSKEQYLTQIRDLENRLTRYQTKCDELTISTAKFKDEYDQIVVDKKEIVSFLKQSIAQRTDELAEINEKLAGLHDARNSEKQQYEESVKALKLEFQETKDQLTSEKMVLSGKLASLEEFKVQKDDLFKKFDGMELELKNREELYNKTIYNLEQKHVVDKDRLKKETVQRVNDVAAEYRKAANKKMQETNRRTIKENVSISNQLEKISENSIDLIKDNDQMKAKFKEMETNLELGTHNENEMAKKNYCYQKVIRMLTEKCTNQEEIILDLEDREHEYESLQKENYVLNIERSRQESAIENLTKDLGCKSNEVNEVKMKLTIEKKNKKDLEKVLQKCASTLKVSLQERVIEDHEETEGDKTEKRCNMLSSLLDLLSNSASYDDANLPDVPVIENLNTPRKIKYNIGGLGLIPNPDENDVLLNEEKTKKSFDIARSNSMKKILTKSMGTQTVSAPKALFYADQLLSQIPASSSFMSELIKAGSRSANVRPRHLAPLKKVC